jgi:hypothetical protein
VPEKRLAKTIVGEFSRERLHRTDRALLELTSASGVTQGRQQICLPLACRPLESHLAQLRSQIGDPPEFIRCTGRIASRHDFGIQKSQ